MTSLSNKTATSQLHRTYCALRPLSLLTQVPSSAASPALLMLRAWWSAPPSTGGAQPHGLGLGAALWTGWPERPRERRQGQSHLTGAPGASRIWPPWVTVLERGPVEAGALGLATS